MMKLSFNMIPETWRLNGIKLIGGLLIGAGIADSIYAINHFDLNQLARGITIFSAGLTILVIIDNSKSNKVTQQSQKETQLQLIKIEAMLVEIQQSEQLKESQLREIKELLHKSQDNIS